MSEDYVDGEHVTKRMRERWAERDALLRVARAAYAYDYCMDEDIGRKHFLLLGMRNALKEAEHLLEVDK